MNHCYIIKIWNCVHMNKVKKLNDFYFKFFPPVYYVLYILLSHDDGDWLQQQGRVSLLYCVCVYMCIWGILYIICLPMVPASHTADPLYYYNILHYYRRRLRPLLSCSTPHNRAGDAFFVQKSHKKNRPRCRAGVV